MNTSLINMIRDCSMIHPARKMKFEDLVRGLFDEVSNGNVNVGYHPYYPQLAIFKYSQDCVTQRNWNKFSLMARGLILDLGNKAVVATPFVKFFNHGELEEAGCSFLEPNFVTTEKVDGSMGIIYHYDGKWRVATCGSFISEQAVWAENWLHENVDVSQMEATHTYLVEIVYPENKIVVSYDFSGLVLLSIFNVFGLEIDRASIKIIASSINLPLVQEYDFSNVGSILEKAKILDHNSEGFVVRFPSGVRLKIKGDEYVRIHRLISRVTPLAIWDMLLNGDDLEDVKKDLPEELENDFDSIVSILKNKLQTLVDNVEAMWEYTEAWTDKKLGLQLQQNSSALEDMFPLAQRYVFMRRKGKFYEGLNIYSSPARRRIFSTFRPTNNLLDGYTPSSVVNRFTEGNQG